MPFPPPDMVFRSYFLSIRMRNLDLFARLLNDWKSSDSSICVTVAVAPLHCLSRYRIKRTVTLPNDSTVVASFFMVQRQLICLIVHFRPTLVTSVTPWAMPLQLSSMIVPFTSTLASFISMSWNFSSIAPAPVNLP